MALFTTRKFYVFSLLDVVGAIKWLKVMWTSTR